MDRIGLRLNNEIIPKSKVLKIKQVSKFGSTKVALTPHTLITYNYFNSYNTKNIFKNFVAIIFILQYLLWSGLM